MLKFDIRDAYVSVIEEWCNNSAELTEFRLTFIRCVCDSYKELFWKIRKTDGFFLLGVDNTDGANVAIIDIPEEAWDIFPCKEYTVK